MIPIPPSRPPLPKPGTKGNNISVGHIIGDVTNFLAPPSYLNDGHIIGAVKRLLPASPYKAPITRGPGNAHGGGGGLAGNGADQPVVPKPAVPKKKLPVSKPGKQKGTPNASVAPPTSSSSGGGGGGVTTPSVSNTGYTPLTPQQLNKLARGMTQPEVNQLVQVWKDAINQLNTSSTSHEAAITGFASALGDLLQPVPGEVSGAYNDAANAVAGYGQGFSQENQQLKQDAGANATSATSANANLSDAQKAEIGNSFSGTPYNVMYGMNGDNPATNLQQLGASLNAVYSKQLPLAVSGYGQEWLGASRAAQLKSLQDLQSKMGEAQGQYPQLFQQNLSNLVSQDQRNQSIAMTRAYENAQLGLSGDRINAAAHKIDPKMSGAYGVQMYSDGTAAVGKDGKLIAYPKAAGASPKVNTKLSSWYHFLVDNNGHPLLANGHTIPVPQSAWSRGSTSAGRQKDIRTSMATAHDAFNGIKDKKGNVVQQPESYAQALRFMTHNGLSEQDARNALNFYWLPSAPGSHIVNVGGQQYVVMPWETADPTQGRPIG